MQYRITGVDSNGKESVIAIKATDEQEAVALAKQQGIYTTNVAVIPSTPPTRDSMASIPTAVLEDASISNVVFRYLNQTVGINFRDAEKLYQFTVL